MASYDRFFFGALFFLIGVFLASFELKFLILIITAILAVIFLVFLVWRKNKKFVWLAGLSFVVIFGALYYEADNQVFQNIKIPFDNETNFSGLIVSYPEIKNSYQEFKLKLGEPFKGKILVKLSLYPSFNYGDEIGLSGIITKPEPIGYERYLAKENMAGISAFPKVNLIAQDKGSFMKNQLFKIKGGIIETFQKVLPQKEAAFLTGLTLGGRSQFSEDFKRAMSLSGTTHLVALSGYNITIIAWAVMGLLLTFLSRRASFLMTILVIVGFVLMTGAESSVVRAAIMGILVLLAREIGRIYDFRNAITLAALLMVLENPKVLAFDIGFQLSFLALLGIVYLRPAIQKFCRISEESGFLSWRDNLLTTASAQLAVAPLLINNFGNFSPISLLTNVLILELIPFTMAIGFFIAFAGLFSYYFALILSLLVSVFLKIEIFIIEFFAKLSFPISTHLSFILVLIYYLAIFSFIVFLNKRKTNV